MSKNLFEKLGALILKTGTKDLMDRLLKKKQKPSPAKETKQEEAQKTHPWRICPIGEHWVNPHPLTVPISETNPDGVTTRNTGCRKNPVRGKKGTRIRDYLNPHEIHAIADAYFKGLTGPPAAGRLPYKNSDKYDALIRGWTKYWNEVLQPTEPLDPDLIKALIASESSFNPDPPKQDAGTAGRANGLIQLTDQAIQALSDPNGELSDQLVKMSADDASDPNIAICAGARWLFRKKDLASRRLGREATWPEGVAEYKGYLKDMISGKNTNPVGMSKINEDYGKLKR